MPEKTDGKNKYGKRAAAVAAMLIAVLVSVALMQYFLCIPDSFDQNRVLMLHREPENSIDVLLIGSSATYSGFSSAYAYEKFGFTSYPYTIGGATCTMWKPALEDALRTQKPKLVVVDVFGGGYERDLIDTRTSQLYIIMNYFPFSKEKISLAKEIAGNVDSASAASMVFPFIKCHTNIPSNIRKISKRLDVERFGPSPLKGIETLTRDRKLAPVEDSSFSEEAEPLDERTEKVILDFIAYCKSQDLDVLFVKYPTVLTENDPDELLVNRRANRILELARDAGYTGLNMQKDFHKIGLKERKDYYNHGHTNTRGQKKVTEHLGEYICSEMGIGPSDLDEAVRAEWDESVRYYDAFCELSEELIHQKKDCSIGESPSLARDLKRIIDGEDVSKIADKYRGD